MSRFFFKVDDLYESYIDKDTRNPYQFVRKKMKEVIPKTEGFLIRLQTKSLLRIIRIKMKKHFPKNTQDILSSII
jgi:hypothetical protein